MVVFDLQCNNDHVFEGWFDDLQDMESQIMDGLLTCPVCGTPNVRQVPAGFAISKNKAPDSPDYDAAAKLIGRTFKSYLSKNFEDVGPRFAKEALKIHYGVTEPRNIRGVSTPAEEETLLSEGVEFIKINDSGPATPQGTPGAAEDED